MAIEKGTDLRTFNAAMERLSKKMVEDAFNELARAVVLEALRRVVFRTRVKTGRARGNWQITFDGPARAIVGTEDPDGNPTIAEQTAIFLAGVRAFRVTWLTNNVPYILKLEELDGMVENTISELSGAFGEL